MNSQSEAPTNPMVASAEASSAGRRLRILEWRLDRLRLRAETRDYDVLFAGSAAA
jgi:hypothetical protein